MLTPRGQHLRVSGEAKPGTFVVSRENTPGAQFPETEEVL